MSTSHHNLHELTFRLKRFAKAKSIRVYTMGRHVTTHLTGALVEDNGLVGKIHDAIMYKVLGTTILAVPPSDLENPDFFTDDFIKYLDSFLIQFDNLPQIPMKSGTTHSFGKHHEFKIVSIPGLGNRIIFRNLVNYDINSEQPVQWQVLAIRKDALKHPKIIESISVDDRVLHITVKNGSKREIYFAIYDATNDDFIWPVGFGSPLFRHPQHIILNREQGCSPARISYKCPITQGGVYTRYGIKSIGSGVMSFERLDFCAQINNMDSYATRAHFFRQYDNDILNKLKSHQLSRSDILRIIQERLFLQDGGEYIIYDPWLKFLYEILLRSPEFGTIRILDFDVTSSYIFAVDSNGNFWTIHFDFDEAGFNWAMFTYIHDTTHGFETNGKPGRQYDHRNCGRPLPFPTWTKHEIKVLGEPCAKIEITGELSITPRENPQSKYFLLEVEGTLNGVPTIFYKNIEEEYWLHKLHPKSHSVIIDTIGRKCLKGIDSIIRPLIAPLPTEQCTRTLAPDTYRQNFTRYGLERALGKDHEFENISIVICPHSYRALLTLTIYDNHGRPIIDQAGNIVKVKIGLHFAGDIPNEIPSKKENTTWELGGVRAFELFDRSYLEQFKRHSLNIANILNRFTKYGNGRFMQIGREDSISLTYGPNQTYKSLSLPFLFSGYIRPITLPLCQTPDGPMVWPDAPYDRPYPWVKTQAQRIHSPPVSAVSIGPQRPPVTHVAPVSTVIPTFATPQFTTTPRINVSTTPMGPARPPATDSMALASLPFGWADQACQTSHLDQSEQTPREVTAAGPHRPER